MNWACSRGRCKAASPHLRAMLLLAAVPELVLPGCHRPSAPSQGISIQESIAPQPVRSGEETVTLRLAGPSGQPLTHAHIQVEGDMDHPGMAPTFSDAVETAPGSYQAPLTFTMGGDWVLLFHIVLPDGRKIEKQIDVKGVESR